MKVSYKVVVEITMVVVDNMVEITVVLVDNMMVDNLMVMDRVPICYEGLPPVLFLASTTM